MISLIHPGGITFYMRVYLRRYSDRMPQSTLPTMIERMMANIEREKIKERVAKLLNMTLTMVRRESEAMMAGTKGR